MADGVISQDHAKIASIAGQIRSEARSFSSTYEDFFSDFASKVGDSGTAWSGPNASKFASEVASKKTQFDTAKTNIVNMANNLFDQASAWATFEGGN